MYDDLDNPKDELLDIKKRLERLESGSNQESTSVDRGRFRIGNAEFRADADSVFSLLGTFNQSGEYHVYDGGSFNVRTGGELNLLSGGDLNVTGDVNVEPGGVVRVDGPVPILLRQGNASGVDQAMVQFGGTGTAIYANSAGGNVNLVIQAGAAILQLNNDGIHIVNLPQGDAVNGVGIDSNGRLVRTSTGGGGGDPGPGNGVFQWPFPLEQVTSEFRTPERPTHDGIDFGIGPSNTEGTPIPCAGDGIVSTILAEGEGHGWGNGVIVDHGVHDGDSLSTLYAHMYRPPVVDRLDLVSLGQTLGGIGNTGNSFGNHLHWETRVNGAPINPRDFMARFGS